MFFRKKTVELDLDNLPRHIGVIMDGNGRWAKKRGLPRSAGHSAGSEAVKKIVTECNNLGIEYITVYAFSTENWKRPNDEVEYLMNLLLNYLKDAEKSLSGQNVVIRVIGSRKELSPEIQAQIIKTEEFTKKNTGIVMNIALNYGAREEMIVAVKEIAALTKSGTISEDEIDDKMFSKHLYTDGQTDPDLIIRTSGEQRLSNFLLWQAAYSELWFTHKNWPDFNINDLKKAILDYQKRGRRFGGI